MRLILAAGATAAVAAAYYYYLRRSRRPENMPWVSLGDGTSIPTVGLGLYYTPPGEDTYFIVSEALRLGYRHLDTAALYGNEADTGRAVMESGIPREKIHITSKVWPRKEGKWLSDPFAAVLDAVKESVKKMGTHADLYLLHWPVNPKQRIDSWRALEETQRLGLVRSIGVSNFGVAHLKELVDSPLTSVVPAANEVEISPFLRKDDIEDFCKQRGIRLIAYSPLARAKRLDHPVLKEIATRHAVTTAQVMVRWSVQRGYVPLPKSVKPERVAKNVGVFGFVLSKNEMAQLDMLDEQLFAEWKEWGNCDPTAIP